MENYWHIKSDSLLSNHLHAWIQRGYALPPGMDFYSSKTKFTNTSANFKKCHFIPGVNRTKWD